jgi:hypothetical protein
VNLGLFLLAFMVLTAEPLRVREVAVGAEEKVIASFTEAADEDPLDNLDDGG